jgi:uncharacterized protein YqjF (DUF2071 family)
MTLFLKANWENIIMVNYQIDPEILTPYLPKGLQLDLYQGKAYISLVGFMFKDTKIFNVPTFKLGTFEEINLRLYVSRKVGNETRRGVVFINETVPYKAVAWLANALYKEHYTVVPTKHSISKDDVNQKIKFDWKLDKKWYSIYVESRLSSQPMQADSFEKFIYEHYYGYTKVSDNKTEGYRLHHPSWKLHEVVDYEVICDFKAMYGESFSVLNDTKPEAVFIAKGSSVAIEWKRQKIDTTNERSKKTKLTK